MAASKRKRAEQPPEDSRDKMLQAATQIFSERGYAGASIRAICERAGFNVAMVRYHFGDKRGLYEQVIRSASDLDARRELLERAVSESSTSEEALRLTIHNVFRRLIARTEESHVYLRLMLNELTHPSSPIKDEVQATMHPLYDQFRKLVGDILKLPIDHPRTRLSAHSVLGQMAHYVSAGPMLRKLWPELRMTPEQVEMISDHIADFSLAALQPVRTESGKRAIKKQSRK